MMAFGAKIKLSVNNSGASAFRSEIQKYVNTATVNNPIKLKNFSVYLTKEQQKKLVKDLQTYLSSNDTLSLKIGKIDAKDAVNKLRQQLQTMLSGLSITGLKEFLDGDNVDEITKDIDNAKQSASRWAAQMHIVNDISGKLGTTYKGALSGSKEITGYKELGKITEQYTEWQQKVEDLRRSKKAMSDSEMADITRKGVEIQRSIEGIQKKQRAEIEANTTSEALAKKELQLMQQQASLKSQVERYILSNGRAYKAHQTELDGILKSLSQEGTLSEETLKRIRIRLTEIQGSARLAGQTGNTFFETLKKGWEKFGGWSLVTKSLTQVWRVVTDIVKAVRDVDAAMTELKKVTDLTQASYNDFLLTAQDMSRSVGATLTDTINATADFARLGYNIADASSLAEASLVYKNVGDGIKDVSEASESLISTIKAFEQFGESANNAMSIVDRFNEVGNNFAISSEGIGEALRRSASALATAGNDLNSSIALITAANSVVQDPDSVGTSLKTISMYLRAAKTETEEAGESTEGMANSVSELRQELLTLTNSKVDIMIDDKTFKSTYEIMKDLSKVWKDLSDIDQANILELIGGKRNANVITSLLSNFEDAENVLQTVADASGSAYTENEKYLDSINGKISILKANFESLSTNTLNSDIVKFVVDLGNVLVIAANSLSKVNMLLPVTIGLISTIRYLNLYKEMQAEAQNAAMQVHNLVISLVAEKNATDGLRAAYQALSKARREEVILKLQEQVASKKITQEDYNTITAKLGVIAATNGEKVAVDALSVSLKTLVKNNPVGIIMTVFSIVAPYIIKHIKQITRSIEEINTEIKEFSSSAQEINAEYSRLKKTIDVIAPRFAELSEGVNEFGNNVALPSDDYEEFLSLSNQIAETFPYLSMGVDENGNHILSLSGSADTLTNSLDELVKAERQAANTKIAEEMNGALPNIGDMVKIYTNEAQNLKQVQNDVESIIERINNASSLENTSWAVSGTMSVADEERLFSVLNQLNLQELVERYTVKGNNSLVIDWYSLINSAEFENAFSGWEKIVSNKLKEANDKWKELNPFVGAWLQTTYEYDNATNNIQQLLLKMFGSIDYSKIGITDAEELKSYLLVHFLQPISDATPEVQKAMLRLFDIKTSLDQGSSDIKGFVGTVNETIESLRASGISEEVISALENSLGYDDLNKRIGKVVSNIRGSTEDVVEYINSLSGTELDIVYEIIKENGSMSIEDLIKKFTDTKDKIESSPIRILSKIEGLSDGLDQLDKIYADILDGGEFDFSFVLNNDAFKSAFEECGDVYEGFIETITKYPKDIKACQSAFNKLTGAYVTNSTELKNVTDATRNATVNMLEQNGITNAAAIVDEQLAAKKEQLRINTELGTDATVDEIAALYDENTTSKLTAQALAELALSKIQANNAELNTASDIDKLEALAKSAGATTESLLNMSKAKEFISKADQYEAQKEELISRGADPRGIEVLENNASNYRLWAEELLNRKLTFNVDFEKYKYTGGSTTRERKSKNSNSEKSKAKDKSSKSWFEKELKKHQHLVAMEKETDSEYLDWLKTSYKKAYNQKIIDLDDYRKYKEEVFEKERELFDDSLNDSEHKISLLEDGDGNEKEIIKIYGDLIKKVEDRIKKARKNGLTDNDDYIQTLQDKLQDYAASIKEIQDDITESAKDALDELVDYRIDMLKQDAENEKDSLNERLDTLKEFYDKQKELLQKQYDEEKNLEERSEKQKKVSDIRSELSMLSKDDSAWGQKRKLELKEELSTAEKELADFEKEDALNKALDALDEAYSSQETKIKQQIEALDSILNNPQTLFNQALNDIKNNSKNQLYYQMLMYNRQYGDGKDETVKTLWEDAYGALQDYKKLFGNNYNGANLKNETNVKNSGKSSNSNQKDNGSLKSSTSKNAKNSNTKKKSNSKSSNDSSSNKKSNKPSLKKGSTIQVKKSATRYGSKSNNVKMASFVPGSKFTVYSTSGDQVLIGRNGVYTGWIKKSDIVGYKSGTKNATAGLHQLYEQGAETLFVSSDGSKYRILNDNDKVFNTKATNFLYDFANTGGAMLIQKLKDSFGSVPLGKISAPIMSNEIKMGDIIINGGANTKTVSEIRRTQRDSVEFMLKEFAKLNR